MPKIVTFQNHFTTGEISPQVQARTDLSKYEGACRSILNGIVMAQGGVTKRPGTRYVATALGDGVLFPFVYSPTQTYAVLFTDKKVQFFTHAGVVENGGTPYTLDSEYALEDLPKLKFAQSADVMYLVHPNHPPRKLMRFGHTDWKFEEVAFTPGIAAPSNVFATPSGFNDDTDTYLDTTTEYKVAAVNMDGEESLPSAAVAADTLSTWPQGARVNVHWDAVPGAFRYEVYKNAHGWFEWIGSTDKTWFLDDNIEPDGSMCPKEYRDPFHAPSAPTVSVSGSTTYEICVSAVNSAGAESLPSTAVRGETVTVSPASDVEMFYVYFRPDTDSNWKYDTLTPDTSAMTIDVSNGPADSGVAAVYEKTGKVKDAKKGYPYNMLHEWKLIRSNYGSHSELAYTNVETPVAGATPTILYWVRWGYDSADKVREMKEKIVEVHDPSVMTFVVTGSTGSPRAPLNAPDSYPGAVGIYQQRLMFGRTNRNPQTVWMSETGSFHSMAVSHPLRNDSAITVTVDSKQMQEIRHFIALNDCFVLTNATEFRMTEKDGAITPGTVGFRPQSFWGASEVPPITIGTTILMLDGSGRTVRDVHYNLQEDGYSGDDRSILATHLLRKPIIDWAYQQNPFSTVYAIREDGVLLTFTYMREQEVWAWARHESSGDMFRSVCCVREDGKDRVYFLVKRTRPNPEEGEDPIEEYFVEEQMLRDYGDDPMDACYLDCSLSGGTAGQTFVTGLDHLSGREVSALVDGTVVTGLTVSEVGTVELPNPVETKLTVGLPYMMEVETVDPSINGQDGSRYGSRKVVGPTLIDMLETGDVQVGTDVNHLEEMKLPVDWGPPTKLYSGTLKTPTPGFARNGASIVIRSNTPMPATVLAVKTEVSVE